MKKIFIWILILLIVAIGAITYFRWESIQQYAQQADETDAPPVVFVSAFIRSLINPLPVQENSTENETPLIEEAVEDEQIPLETGYTTTRDQEIGIIVEPTEFTYEKADNVVVKLDREGIFEDEFLPNCVGCTFARNQAYFYVEGDVRYQNTAYFEEIYRSFSLTTLKKYHFEYVDQTPSVDTDPNWNGIQIGRPLYVLENKKRYTDEDEANKDLAGQGAGGLYVVALGENYLLLSRECDTGAGEAFRCSQLQQQIAPTLKAN